MEVPRKQTQRDVVAGFAYAGRQGLAAGRMFNAISTGMETNRVTPFYVLPMFARNVIFGTIMFKTYARVYASDELVNAMPWPVPRSFTAGCVAGLAHGSLTAAANRATGVSQRTSGLLLSQALAHGVFFPVYEVVLDRTQVWLNTNLEKRGGVLCVMFAGAAAGLALGGTAFYTRQFEKLGIQGGLRALRHANLGVPSWSILFSKVPFFGAGMLAFEYAGRMSNRIQATEAPPL